MYYFIVNPFSSSGKGLKIWQKVESQLRRENVEYRVAFTNHHGHASELAMTISSRFAPCTIVAVGGDGTANEVINGLTNYSMIQFGYIPSGSGNDLARGLGLSAHPEPALHAILHPMAIKPISIGSMTTSEESRRFIVSCGVGFDAAICHEAMSSPLKKILNRFGLGKLTYLGIALKQLFLLKPSPVTMILDDRRQFEFDGIFFAAAMNLRYEGGGFMFCPDADPTDGYLDICLVEKMPKLRILNCLPTAYSGQHVNYTGVHIFRCRKAMFRSLCPQALHTDGENAGTSKLITIELLPEQLPVIVA